MPPEIKVDDITDALRKRILDGEFGTGGRLPSLRMFASQYGTTQETMNKVVQRLQAEGVLSSLGRQGVFVHIPRTRIPGILPRFDLYLKELGLDPVETNIESPDLVPAPDDVAKALGVPVGSTVVHRRRRQGTSTSHYLLAENFYPVDLAGGSILEHMQKDEQFDVLLAIKNAYGKAVSHVHEDVIGRLPTSHEQDWLKLVRGTPVLEVVRTNYAE
ncbi:MAG TPA: GntR family transcriptional regulator, partial [Ktedonobacteraceae bacterium]|nr:GntR family transcriptional regulator [Ktedonobacteraceae bacterium]